MGAARATAQECGVWTTDEEKKSPPTGSRAANEESADVKSCSTPPPTQSPGSLLTYRNIPDSGTAIEPGGSVTSAAASGARTTLITKTPTPTADRSAFMP